MFQNLLFPWSLERLYVQLVRTMNSHGTSASPGGHACIILIFEVHTCIILKLLLEEHAIAAVQLPQNFSHKSDICQAHFQKASAGFAFNVLAIAEEGGLFQCWKDIGMTQ